MDVHYRMRLHGQDHAFLEDVFAACTQDRLLLVPPSSDPVPHESGAGFVVPTVLLEFSDCECKEFAHFFPRHALVYGSAIHVARDFVVPLLLFGGGADDYVPRLMPWISSGHESEIVRAYDVA